LAAPKEIVELVDRFENNLASYKSGHYNETQVRREFVDPFFKALGWDVDNEQGFAEAYKDVIHEDAVKVGTTTKAPDYSFRIGGQRKFFLETKKPSVDIKDDIHPAFQLRRYAWTMKLPLSVLTDFEEFAVYDCNVKPDKTDKASNARIFYLNYKDYLTRWDEIAGIFSKNAVLKGSFDKYAADKKSKRGTSAVDVVFLEEIAGWREILARNIALRNPDLSTKDLNYAVQAIVNRIVFLRICEDRGIERYMRLQDLLNGERVYPRLCELFRRADERYNSGIFHFEKEPGRESPDTLTLSLNIDDKPLKEIFKRLYYPDSPYEFSVLPAEILGQVYEQFLGKVIRLTEGHRAVIEDKPEVKKAGGVKYTPVYIVENIVGNTLGKILKGKTPLEVVLITVLDPACGSGSFLIVAYQYLLDWHRDWYVQNLVPLLQSGLKPSSPEIRRLLPGVETGKKGRKKEPELPVYQGRGGEWRLTTAERKRILLNNIYGVDIDRQAVEVTKLSLLLKVLEGENEETISKQLKLFQERALPDLSNNIKCGNSLIGWDILEDNPNLGQEEIERINPFDWEREFSEVFSRGGFDVVIGNPPYVRVNRLSAEKFYYKNTFKSASGSYDIYVVFMEKALDLIRSGGEVGLITPNKYFVSDYGSNIRNLILNHADLHEIADMGKCKSVFQGALISTAISFFKKSEHTDRIALKILSDENVRCISEIEAITIPRKEIITKDGCIRVYQDSMSQKIVEKMTNGSEPLGDTNVAYVRTGIMGFDYWSLDRFIDDSNTGRLIATNSYIDRYQLLWGKKVKIYKRDLFKPRLSPSCNVLNENTLSLFASKKILVRGIARRLTATLDEEGIGMLVAVHSVQCKKYENKFLLGLLNSNLFNWLHRTLFYSARIPEGSLRYPISFLYNLPIWKLDLTIEEDRRRYHSIIDLVNSMLSLHKQLQEACTPHDEIALQRQIDATDRQIDALVYELYGLTEEEIRIVEGECV
jgi:adenine-specific DNA methylase